MLSPQTLEIPPHPTILFAQHASTRLPEQVRRLGKPRAFIVTDRGVARSGILDRIAEVLAADDLPVSVFDGVEPNPTTDNIAAGSAALRAVGDAAVVAVGGGSAMDTAKGIALHATNDVPVAELDYRNAPQQPGLPIVAVPTTAGTGSETNTFGVITNPELHRKFYVGHASVQPRVAILDPNLTLGLPPRPTAAAGIDAFTHALEALASRHANPYADGIALQVIRMVATWLPKAVADGSDTEARSQMLLAAHLAGLAFRTTGLGICHGLGHPLGARLGAAHGLTLAIMLPHIMRFNLPVRADKYAQVAFAMGVGDTRRSEAENAQAAIDAVRRLTAAVGTDRSLRDIGCTEELLPTLVTDALEDEVMASTPRFPTGDEVKELLLAAL